jgi:heterodisulfide reductase subunit A
MRAAGKDYEELYASTSRKNTSFLMFDQQQNLPKVNQNGKSLKIEFKELLSGEKIQIKADMVVLMTAMESQNNSKEIAHLTGISIDKDGFFIEKHPKLDPVATTTEGVYIAGSCQSPKDIPESIVQAKAAAARILATIAKGKVEVEATTAHVNEEVCCGCQFCVSVCPYAAISFNEEKGISEVNEILCKGCGTCASGCPSGALISKHFTDEQILSQINGVLDMLVEPVD